MNKLINLAISILTGGIAYMSLDDIMLSILTAILLFAIFTFIDIKVS